MAGSSFSSNSANYVRIALSHITPPLTATLSGQSNVTDWLTAIGTIGTLIVAAAAAFVAFGQFRESRRLREAQAQPFVVVDVEPSIVSRRILNLVIRNTGQTLARDVTINFVPPLKSTIDANGYPVSDFRPLKNGIPALPPGREYQVMLDSTVERFRSNLPDKYSVTVRFSDRDGRKMDALEYEIDLAIYRGAQYVQELSINDLVKEVKHLRQTLDSWARMTGEHYSTVEQAGVPTLSARKSRVRGRENHQGRPRWMKRPSSGL